MLSSRKQHLVKMLRRAGLVGTLCLVLLSCAQLPSGSEIRAISLVGSFTTGCNPGSNCEAGAQHPVPSTDPAGIVYHGPTGHLFIVDSEVEELVPPENANDVFANVGANVFELPLAGDALADAWNVNVVTNAEPANAEPTGIAYCPNDGHFYVVNDDSRFLYRYALDRSGLTAVAWQWIGSDLEDPEDVACDPSTGRIYVVGGTDVNILVYRYRSSFVLESVIDLAEAAAAPSRVPSDPEGLAFDTRSGHLFVISGAGEAIFEYTTAGVFVKKFDISGFSPAPIAPQGLTIGPASEDSRGESFYIVDGGIDNDDDPDERDGRVYEARIER